MATTDSVPSHLNEAKFRGQSLAADLAWWRTDSAVLIYIAAATVLVHLIAGRQYGFQRDELATLEDARHLAWGFVAYPPITPFFGRLSLILFGTSLTGFRFFAAVVEAIAVVLTGFMALATRRQTGRTTRRCRCRPARLPWWRIPHAVCGLRLFLLGAHSLLRRTPAKNRRSAVVARHWCLHRLRHGGQIHDGILCACGCRRTCPPVLAPLPQIQMALVRCGTLHSGFTSQSSLAGPASFRFACLPPAHPHPRCASRPHQVFSPRSIKVHDLCRPALALRPVLLSHFP